MRNRREQGMALITALLVLLLISSMIVGMSFLVLTDQKLGGNNADRQRAFYGAEAGMESLTTSLQDCFLQQLCVKRERHHEHREQYADHDHERSRHAVPESRRDEWLHRSISRRIRLPSNLGNPTAHESHDSFGHVCRPGRSS